MTVAELINALSEYPHDMWVDCNDCHGIYTDILCVENQEWTDRDGKEHEVVTIKHKGYNAKNSLI